MKTYLKKIWVALICFGLHSNMAISQNQGLDLAEIDLNIKNISTTVLAEGSPYITEEFLSLKLEDLTTKIYSGRYNAYNGEMEIKLSDDKIIALDNNADYTITFIASNKKYKTYTYKDADLNLQREFLVVVSKDSSFTLLKKEHIKFQDKVKPKSSYDKEKPAKFIKANDTYYLNFENNTRVLSLNKKQFLSSFPKTEVQLKSYIKKNKLSLKDENDLIKIVAYLSSISKP
ncbi:hypothetical protein [Winogradskyella ludwigii]|jgi:hypothetical protein|uniref:hypothetical protein n=1 Tax=Winogradskyella ludwigii TaxID=2686076 RepID=UPI0015CD83CF|nr:hypothetical protein [Winogradskyella ludwigii]